MSRTVNVHEAKTHLSRPLEQVSQGEDVIIAKAGRPVARLVPIAGGAKSAGLAARRGRSRSLTTWTRRCRRRYRGPSSSAAVARHPCVSLVGADSPKLSGGARSAIGDGRNEPIFSVVSGWEISTKAGLGKLKFPDPPERFVPRQVSHNGMAVLPIYLRHALRVHELPGHHQDPFDRLLIAQALVEDLPVLTADPLIRRYPIEVLW